MESASEKYPTVPRELLIALIDSYEELIKTQKWHLDYNEREIETLKKEIDKKSILKNFSLN